ncbi:MAG TPA: RNA-guided endonuclease IscB [Atribacterota bacterium]|nr:RNA-guided endonuclease IscB [Atribacterota bacterium]
MKMVFVVDKNKRPLNMCHSAKARKLLSDNKAVVISYYPFVIRLKKEVNTPIVADYQIKIDPGAKWTGLAILQNEVNVNFLGVLKHKAFEVVDKLKSRSSLRHGRRSRKTRYRQPRFDNRGNARKLGRIMPSLRSRFDNITNWIKKLQKFCPIGEIVYENVKFDTQLLENPDIVGTEYQRGELCGFEIIEYLREKTGFKCAYCGKGGMKEKLEVEHIIPRSRNGSNRISNLTLACHKCNQKKGNMTAKEFGKPEVQGNAKKPLKDTAMVNSSRKRMYEELKQFNLPIRIGSGGRTKWNRIRQGLPKTHWFDACCIGVMGEEKLKLNINVVLEIGCCGRGRYKICDTDKYGFPKAWRGRDKKTGKCHKVYQGFTGQSIIRAEYKGKIVKVLLVSPRMKGSFTMQVGNNKISVSPKKCSYIQRFQGYKLRYITKERR